MNIRQLCAVALLAMAPAAWSQQAAPGQEKPEARQQPKATVKGEPSTAARKATGLQEPKKDGQPDRRERAMQISGSVQKKTNETSSAAASNVK